MVKSPEIEHPVKAFGWAASDSFGTFSPFNFSRRLRNLEIVGARLEDDALFDALRACPNLTHLLLIGCEGLRHVSIQNPNLEQCGLILVFICYNLFPDVHRFLLLRVYMVVFGKLVALESLSIRGVQWCWQAINTMLQMASEVDSRFQILCLEKVVVTVRPLLNAKQKMSTLDSLIRYAENLKKMTIKILQTKSSHSSADEFFEDICRFRYMNCKIVSIE
ncbi:hypothetical protein ACS0TY_011229 [Phlomoides rotata]